MIWKGNYSSIHIMAFWVVTPYNDMVGDQYFGIPCCLQLQGVDGGSNPYDDLNHHHENLTT
jgi:hypothetical protein